MSHVVIIVQKTILPPPDAQADSPLGEMTAEVRYQPAAGMSDAQIGSQVERVLRRLTKLADD